MGVNNREPVGAQDVRKPTAAQASRPGPPWRRPDMRKAPVRSGDPARAEQRGDSAGLSALWRLSRRESRMHHQAYTCYPFVVPVCQRKPLWHNRFFPRPLVTGAISRTPVSALTVRLLWREENRVWCRADVRRPSLAPTPSRLGTPVSRRARRKRVAQEGRDKRSVIQARREQGLTHQAVLKPSDTEAMPRS